MWHNNYKAAATPAKYKRDIQWPTCVLTMLENSENNETEKICIATPTHGLFLHVR